MHRKLFLLAFLGLASVSMVAKETESSDTLGVHPWKDAEVYSPNLSHWSIYLAGGFSHFDGDNGVKLAASEQMNADGGFGFSYTFTPTWSAFAEWHSTTYGQHMYSGDDFDELIENGGRALGWINTVEVGLGYNLINAFFPRRKHSLFNLYVQAGGGIATYQYHGSGYNYSDFDRLSGAPTKREAVYDAYTNGKGKWVREGEDGFHKTNAAAFISGGVLAEFNITRVFGLGLRAYYDYFMNDYIDGGSSLVNKNNKNNDGLFGCDMSFRFNILARSASHMRNIPNLEMFEAGLAKEQPRQKDTLVISSRDTIVSINETHTEVKGKTGDRYFYVYFDNDVDQVDNQGLATIQQVATLLERDTTLCAEIKGYCDNTGNLAYNKDLSNRRATNVLSEFAEEYGFNRDRAYTVPMGAVVSRRSKGAFAPNRRVEIRLVSHEEFVEMKAAHEESMKNESNQNAPLSMEEIRRADFKREKDIQSRLEKKAQDGVEELEKAGEQLQNELESKAAELLNTVQPKQESEDLQSRVITLQEGETLAKVARREYGNTHCWVYIYEANAVRMANPSNVTPGMSIILPALSEEQKAITREEANARYNAHK